MNISFSEEFQTTTITGAVTNCNGTPLTKGYVFVDQYNTISITDGIINIGLQHCMITTTQIQIFDFETSQWTISNEITLNGETINLGLLSTCEDVGGIFNGDVTLTSQTEVNEFGQFSFISVNGDLRIADDAGDIVDLTPLETLTTITSLISVFSNENLESLNGLQNLETIGGRLFIGSNTSLTTLSGLDSLESVTDLSVIDNPILILLEGFSNISNITGRFILENNDMLTSLNGLESITSLTSILLKDNDQLALINALSNLSSLNGLAVYNNDALITLIGLEQITELSTLWVANNEALIELYGLENLTTVTANPVFPSILIGFGIFSDTVDPGPNPNLTDFCALEGLFANGNGLSIQETIQIDNNAYNPSPQDIADSNCSQQ